jgi:hypothetical protein
LLLGEGGVVLGDLDAAAWFEHGNLQEKSSD